MGHAPNSFKHKLIPLQRLKLQNTRMQIPFIPLQQIGWRDLYQFVGREEISVAYDLKISVYLNKQPESIVCCNTLQLSQL